MCRVLYADANAEPVPHPDAFGFSVANAKPNALGFAGDDVNARHQRAAGGCDRFGRRIDQ